jgi:hypothetical protein
MTHPLASTGHVSLQVRDQEGTAFMVRLTVDESDASGTLSILTPAGGVARQLALTHLKKARDGTRLDIMTSNGSADLRCVRGLAYLKPEPPRA